MGVGTDVVMRPQPFPCLPSPLSSLRQMGEGAFYLMSGSEFVSFFLGVEWTVL
ncbi:hypothetical protein SAMN05216412_103293 [Nitrosospira multiformis]|uniref:Uncharacterized protein n=1 Tax=Nitrosospira multiformis TaxID=1231 RepID=A0A1I0C5G7_9PROT|nr:hypothetical protein SAMN05216412_103293 [Nitrosospira multiformis]